MAFTALEKEKIERAASEFLEVRRPPVAIRSKVDLDVQISDQNVEVIEVRPYFREPSTIIKVPVAKATYVRKRQRWKVYWMRGNLKWCLYEPEPELRSIEEFFALVNADEKGCFFG